MANTKDQKDCCSQQFPKYHQNFHLLAILLLQSDTSLIPLWKHKVMTRIRSKGWANQVMSHDRSPAFLKIPIYETFLKGKCSLWVAKILNGFFWGGRQREKKGWHEEESLVLKSTCPLPLKVDSHCCIVFMCICTQNLRV